MESVELAEFYMEPSLILLEPACEPIVMGFSRIFSFFRCFFVVLCIFLWEEEFFQKATPEIDIAHRVLPGTKTSCVGTGLTANHAGNTPILRSMSICLIDRKQVH